MTLALLQELADGAALAVESIAPAPGKGSPGPPLVCARCGHAITTSAARVAVNGRHLWTRENAHGYVHHFGCFAAAPGCTSVGVPTVKDTWFAGYHWQLQHCAACDEHLGWLFFSTGASFYGLIANALREGPQPGTLN